MKQKPTKPEQMWTHLKITSPYRRVASFETLHVFATNTPVMFPFACQTALTIHMNRFCQTESDTMCKMPVFNPRLLSSISFLQSLY